MLGFLENDNARPRTIALIRVGIILFLTLVSYHPATEGEFIWDDDNYVTNNYTLKSITGLRDIWFKPSAIPQYYPLVHTTFWIEYHLWQLNPLGYHLSNIFLHLISAILVWNLMSTLTIPGAWLIGVVFAIHPVHVESVAWITERKNVLSGFFYLLSCIAFVKYINSNRQTTDKHAPRYALYGVSLFLYLCALLSKTVTCTLPVTIVIILWWRDEFVSRRTIIHLLPFFVIGTILGLFTVHLEKYQVGAHGAEWDIPFLGRCIIAGRALWFYLGKIVWPQNLTFIYPRWDISSDIWYNVYFPLSFMGLLGVLYLSRNRWGKGPLVTLLIFGATLFPALGFFDVYPMRYSFVADHFQYLASIPIIATIVVGIVTANVYSKAVKFTGQKARVSRIPMVPLRLLQVTLVFLTVSTLGYLTWNRCHAFENAEALWLDTLAKNPKAWMAHNNLGLLYANRNLTKKAVHHYEQAIAVKPDHTYAYNNLAMEWEKQGNPELAKYYFQKALELAPNDINLLNHCGNFFARQHEIEKAKILYNRALKITPSAVSTLINLGNLFAQIEDYGAALNYYAEALSRNPNLAEAHFNMGNVLSFQKRTDEAVMHYKSALKIRPNFHKAQENLLRLLPKAKDNCL